MLINLYEKALLNDHQIETAVSDTQCTTTCSDGKKCGGPNGLISIYTDFKAFSTLDLVLEVTDLRNDTVATTEDDIKDASNKVSTGEVNISLGNFSAFLCFLKVYKLWKCFIISNIL